MAQNDGSWLPELIRILGPFGFFALMVTLALGVVGLALCLCVRSRTTLIIYSFLAQLPIVLCLAGALRSWLIVHAVIRETDVVLQDSQWAEIWKETFVMILWGLGCSLPLDILAIVGLRRCRRKDTPSAPTP